MAYLGVDLGGTNIKAALVTEEGKILREASVPTALPRSPETVCDDIVKLCTELASGEWVEAIGVGCPGSVDRGRVLYSNNLNWHDFDMAEYLQSRIGLPVYIGNDANVAALGEMWQGAGKGYQDVLMVTLRTGVGGGCVLDGKIVSGIHGAGGEIGHMPVKDDEPIACNCDNHGCLEQYVSATGIVTQAKKFLDMDDCSSSLRDYECLEAKHIYDEAKKGDVVANELVDSTCKILAKALAQVCSVIDPEIIVIGGGVSKAGDILTSRISTFFKEYAFHACKNTPIVLAKLENDAGMYGCVKSLF